MISDIIIGIFNFKTELVLLVLHKYLFLNKYCVFTIIKCKKKHTHRARYNFKFLFIIIKNISLLKKVKKKIINNIYIIYNSIKYYFVQWNEKYPYVIIVYNLYLLLLIN